MRVQRASQVYIVHQHLVVHMGKLMLGMSHLMHMGRHLHQDIMHMHMLEMSHLQETMYKLDRHLLQQCGSVMDVVRRIGVV